MPAAPRPHPSHRLHAATSLSSATGTEDHSRQSFSHSFFVSEPSNRVMTEAVLGLIDPKGTSQNYCPATTISDGKGGYVGAFRDASDNWLDGWTNFYPQNTAY